MVFQIVKIYEKILIFLCVDKLNELTPQSPRLKPDMGPLFKSILSGCISQTEEGEKEICKRSTNRQRG